MQESSKLLQQLTPQSVKDEEVYAFFLIINIFYMIVSVLFPYHKPSDTGSKVWPNKSFKKDTVLRFQLFSFFQSTGVFVFSD